VRRKFRRPRPGRPPPRTQANRAAAPGTWASGPQAGRNGGFRQAATPPRQAVTHWGRTSPNFRAPACLADLPVAVGSEEHSPKGKKTSYPPLLDSERPRTACRGSLLRFPRTATTTRGPCPCAGPAEDFTISIHPVGGGPRFPLPRHAARHRDAGCAAPPARQRWRTTSASLDEVPARISCEEDPATSRDGVRNHQAQNRPSPSRAARSAKGPELTARMSVAKRYRRPWAGHPHKLPSSVPPTAPPQTNIGSNALSFSDAASRSIRRGQEERCFSEKIFRPRLGLTFSAIHAHLVGSLSKDLAFFRDPLQSRAVQ